MNMNSESTVTWRKICDMCGNKFEDSMTKLFGRFPCRVSDFKVSHGTCKSCSEKRKMHYKKLFYARDLHWTFDSIKDYFEKNPPYKGQELIVLDTSGNLNTYTLVYVEVPESGKQKRIIIDGYTNGYSGQSFYRSGKNCFAPKGQVRLLPYDERIGALIKSSNKDSIHLELERIMSIVGEKIPETL
ncbi:hypothetical protein [Aliivibrio sp. 1S128]|uniref:hypothetical protein n=1 Tax=Aliivibrio sp. 1S128 TaxID=1840085 RepID=UPI00080E534F|nr:hypothetical protein [Aliivibrio sp. 1S128]OCH14578.1 hypothetical protein A6E03_16770 [Aliivibrio sp. 1S128]